MSEYQYYEFAAIDQPLSPAQIAELRAVSTRAQITPTGFSNHYEWGDLKASPAEWMRRYFDAFVYTANWGSYQFAARVPLATFHQSDLAPFVVQETLSIEAADAHWIFHWSLDESWNDERLDWADDSRWMHRLAPLRDELLRGDLRALYLGWLAAATSDELDDDTLEPPVPRGLPELSAPQQALAEFLEIDPDILAAATAGRAQDAPGDAAPDDHIDAWLKDLPRQQMAAILKLIAQGEGHIAERDVRTRHAAWLKARHPRSTISAPRRSLGQLRELAQAAASVRHEHEAAEQAQQERERQKQREATLRLLMADVDKHWAEVDALAQRGSGLAYEQAVRMIAELAQGHALVSSRKDFDQALQQLLTRHAKRGALMRRLADANLWSS